MSQVRDKVRLRNHPASRNIDFLILFFMGGIIIFYGFADFDQPLWASIYYVWNKTEDFVAFGCIWMLAPKNYKKIILPVVVFSAMRMTWEILALLLGQNVNSIMIVDYLFAITVVILITLYVRKWLAG